MALTFRQAEWNWMHSLNVYWKYQESKGKALATVRKAGLDPTNWDETLQMCTIQTVEENGIDHGLKADEKLILLWGRQTHPSLAQVSACSYPTRGAHQGSYNTGSLNAYLGNLDYRQLNKHLQFSKEKNAYGNGIWGRKMIPGVTYDGEKESGSEGRKLSSYSLF